MTYLNRYLGTTELARHLGITYRQLHWATNRHDYTDRARHKRDQWRMIWGPPEIRRLEVAVALYKAWPETGQSVLPTMIRAVFAAEPPPDEGWVVYDEERISYTVSPPRARGLVAIELPELWPLDDRGESTVQAPPEKSAVRTYRWRQRQKELT